MSAVGTDWHGEARSLRDQGLSERAIAEAVGKSPSTVHEALKGYTPNGNGHAPEPTEGQQSIDGEEVPAPQPPLEEIRVDGTAQLGFFDAGGKRPQSASLRLTGGKVLLIDGKAFRKGEVLTGSFTAVVEEVAQRDKADPKTGIVVSAEQKHSARITDLRVG